MMIDTPRVSFLVTVYNHENYIDDCMRSILNQTEQEFNLVVVDDGSTDGSGDKIHSYRSDPRVRIISFGERQGIAAAANAGLDLIDSEYLCRLDSDDIALPGRLERQLRFMDQNAEVGVCGSYVKYFGVTDAVWKMPVQNKDIKTRLIWNNCMAHQSVMIRTDVTKKNAIEYTDIFNTDSHSHFPPYADYSLWMKLLPLAQFHNIPEVLTLKRETGKNLSDVNREQKLTQLKFFYSKNFPEFGLEVTDEELDLHLLNTDREKMITGEILKAYRKWMERLNDHFGRFSYMDKDALRNASGFEWNKLAPRVNSDMRLLTTYISRSPKPFNTVKALLRKSYRKS